MKKQENAQPKTLFRIALENALSRDPLSGVKPATQDEIDAIKREQERNRKYPELVGK